MYHVMSRGDQREDIFLDDVDRQDYVVGGYNGISALNTGGRALK